MFKSHFVNGNETQKYIFKLYSNKLTKIKTLSKKMFYKSEFDKNKGDPRKIWKTIGSLLPSENKSSNNPSNTVVITVATNRNCKKNRKISITFFAPSVKILLRKISTLPSNRFKSYLKNRVSSSMFLEPSNISEIVALMQALDVNKAVGHDNIPAFFIKVSKFVIAPYLNILIDFAFSNGIFPDSCKTAKVIPLLKSGNVNDLNNYRPISILTCFSKIFEKLLHKRLYEFLNKNNVIIPTQYGFQTNFRTSHAVLDYSRM